MPATLNYAAPSPRTPGAPAWAVNLGIALLLAALWPLNGLIEENLNPYYYQILVLVGVNATLATSLNLINGVTGQFSLGHAGFMGIGAYTAAILMKYYAPAGLAAFGGTAAALALGGLAAAAAGVAIGVPALRLRGDYLAIATLGFGEIITILIKQQDRIGRFEVGGAAGLHSIPLYTNLFWAGACATLCVVTVWRIAHSAKGKAFLAIRDDEVAAAAMGVDTTFYKVAAFAIGAFFAGVAGGLSALWIGDLDPEAFGFMRSVEIVIMVVLGGSGSITGALLAAAVLTVLPEQLRFLKEWRMVIYALLLILLMIFRPEGLLGRRELWWTRKRLASVGATGAAGAADLPAASTPLTSQPTSDPSGTSDPNDPRA